MIKRELPPANPTRSAPPSCDAPPRHRVKILGAAAVALLLGFVAFDGHTIALQQEELAAAPVATTREQSELNRLRGETEAAGAQLLQLQAELQQMAEANVPVDAELEAEIARWLERVGRLRRHVAENPGTAIPELEFLAEDDWLAAARETKTDTEIEVREVLRKLHDQARSTAVRELSSALWRFTAANGDRLPDSIADLAALATRSLPPAMLSRYAMLRTGAAGAVPANEWILAEKAALAGAIGSRAFVAPDSHGTEDLGTVSERQLRQALRAFVNVHAATMPVGPAQLLPFFAEPLTPAAQQEFIARPASQFTPAELQKILNPAEAGPSP
jgi:hypothetical protein